MKIFYVYDENATAEGFADEQGNFLAAWYENDAMWRGEYMDRLMKALGIEVSYEKDPARQKAFIDYLKKRYGHCE